MFEILTEYSSWYSIICILIGAAYAFVLYTRKVPWGKSLNYTLAFFRFVIVTALCFLLLGPYVKVIENFFEKPIVVFTVDNSQSIKIVNDTSKIQHSITSLQNLSNQLKEEDYQVEIKGLSGKDDSYLEFKEISFTEGQSNISQSLRKIQQQYENQNLVGIVLFSDGIYNQGTSPLYNSYKTKISTVGIGDSLPKTDLNLKNIYANRIAYLDNKFPIQVEIINSGFVGNTAQIILSGGGKEIERKTIRFSEDETIQKVDFLVEATKKGLQRYIVRINPLEGEFTSQNNSKNVYVDVLDSKEKVLLVAASPHPDIKAFRSAIEKGKNYQFDVLIPGMTDRTSEAQKLLNEKYDLIIFYQVPNKTGRAGTILASLLEKKAAKLFVLGGQSNFNRFNKLSQVAQVQSSGRNFDKVTPFFNARFDRFSFEDDSRSVITKFPPATVPFGEYSIRTDLDIVLFQKVGSITTNKPLLAVGITDDVRTGILFGEGIWQWRLQEFALNENQKSFDDLIGKLVQYLSSKEDKRKFRVYPTNNEFNDFETVFFETEVYNDIYEQVYGQSIQLKLVKDDGEETEYVYVNSSPGFRYAINGLSEGIYKFTASASLNGRREVSSGEFSVRELEIEAINTKANFNLMRQLAQQTGGSFTFAENIEDLSAQFIQEKAPDIIHSQENTVEIIELPWLLAIIILLVSFEWFMRKYKGSY